jgi:ABC-type phosphate transport system permease subunit
MLQESDMNKLFGIAVVVYLLGDPGLSLIDGLNIAKEYVVAIALALVTIPWVASQFDN